MPTVIRNTLFATCFASMSVAADDFMWINHFDFLPGDASLSTTHHAVDSGVGGGLTALVVSSNTIGEIATGGGNKVVHQAVSVPPGYTVEGVRVCYEYQEAVPGTTFISQIRLAQVQDPPATATVMLDDATDQNAPGPNCVDSTATSVDPADGALLLSLRLNFADTSDLIAIRGAALVLSGGPGEAIDDLNDAFANHTHTYLTGKSAGHNNTEATSSGPVAAP